MPEHSCVSRQLRNTSGVCRFQLNHGEGAYKLYRATTFQWCLLDFKNMPENGVMSQCSIVTVLVNEYYSALSHKITGLFNVLQTNKQSTSLEPKALTVA